MWVCVWGCLPRRLLFLLLCLCLFLALCISWQKGSCVWLSGDNREEREEVLKEEHVINDFSCIILAFFLRCRPLCPALKIMAVNFFKG